MARGQLSPILDPSWTRVERFGQDNRPSAASLNLPRDAMQVDSTAGEDDDNDDDWEYEETEHLVTLDLGPESKRLLQMSHQYSITGLEGPTPFLRLGNVIFKGTWDQLIGTDILLRDHKDASSSRGGGGGGASGGAVGGGGGVTSSTGPSSSSTSASATQKHDLQPMPPTKTDLRTGKAPGTTRSRIQFRPAVNMVAREQALRNPAARQQSTLATPSITHKGGWIWVRGKGWIRKEQMVDMGLEVEQQQDGDNEADRTTTSAEQSFTGPAESIASGGPRKPGRKKMSLEEKMSQSVYKSMMKMRNEGKEQASTAQASEAANRTGGAADAAALDNTDTDALMETEGV